MTEFQITSWRDLPSMVVAREGDDVVKLQLAPRLQEAIDEAAMRLGDVGSDDYLAGWVRGEWTAAEGDPTTVAGRIAADLEAKWSETDVTAYLDTLTQA
jgi:hypothetical protein